MTKIDRIPAMVKPGGLILAALIVSLLAGVATPTPAAPVTLTITVQDVDAAAPAMGGFYYTIQEDNTVNVVPGVYDTPSNSVLLQIANSHASMVAAGTGTGNTAIVTIPDSTKRYYVSCLPWIGSGPVNNGPPADATSGYTLGSAPVSAGQAAVTVKVHSTPIPTAQIWVLAFEDYAPLNGAPDTPAEPGLAGFSVQLQDRLGRVSQDAFGNPLGTTYQQNPDGSFILNPNGTPAVATLGTGALLTDANGECLIRFLFPGKYGVFVTPPTTGPNANMVQTTTIEGTPSQDNWVMAGEPPYILNKGIASWHTFIGFVHPTPAPGGPGTVTGQVVIDHESGPPNHNLVVPGPPVPQAWVSLCNLELAGKQLLYAGACNADGTFTIAGVPPGTYSLSAWDTPALDQIIDFRTVVVPPTGGVVDAGQVAIFSWFGHLEGSVFHDANRNGVMDAGEAGISNVPVKIRLPDGSIAPGMIGITDSQGHYSFDEVFPFFNWTVPEVDNTRFKATGATMVVDAGGPLPDPSVLQTPQVQPGGGTSRTETASTPGGPGSGVLTEAMLLYGGNTNTINWGKDYYQAGEHGGIYGVVSYDTTRAEDNAQYGTQEAWQPGIPRVTVNLFTSDSSGNITNAMPVQTTQTTSWDDNLPTGCVGSPQSLSNGAPIMDCAETMKTWGQMRPGIYDGMYGFQNLTPGYYVVQVVPPPGYKVVHIEDRNIFFGAAPAPNVLPPLCVGDPYTVPGVEQLFPGQNVPVPAPYAGSMAHVCDRKLALVRDGQNFNANFFLFTEAPIAGRIFGMCLNDLTLEFNPASPQFGNNYGVPFIPVSIKDYAGVEISRVYTDQWGEYNALTTSTYTINPPFPTGVAPNIVQIVLNDPGPIPDPANPGQFIQDPHYNPAYEVVPYELDVWPGTTLYADTPILPIAAFSGLPTPLDCEAPDHTPLISQVNGSGAGPYVATPTGTISIIAVGTMTIANPDYPTVPGSTPTITRDFGFGATQGKVSLNGIDLPDGNVTWSSGVISVILPAGSATGQLLVTRGDNGNVSIMGVTLHVGGPTPTYVSQGQSIQSAIDLASPGDLIMVGPGTYNENLIMWKKIQLQGAGPFATHLMAGPIFGAQVTAWTNKMTAIETSGAVDLVPGEAANFNLETAAGVTVVAKNDGSWATGTPALIDGFDIEQAMLGGGIYVNTYAPNTHLSNNRIRSNQGTLGGGIRVGNALLECASFPDAACPHQYYSSHNENMVIAYNQILANGSTDGAGGVGLFEGSDNYSFHDNVVCGNFTLLYGGGVCQTGLAPGGSIVHNVILNNQAFDEGGGVMIVGELVPSNVAQTGPYQSDGTGSTLIDKNLIQGNMGGDDGGGLRLLMVNGEDIRLNPSDPTQWNQTLVTNNMIINNSSGDLGGGIALMDSVRTAIINNTIAYNDSTSTGSDAFGPCSPGLPPGQVCPPQPAGGIANSVPQVGGIGAQATNAGLVAIMATSPVPTPNKQFSNPILQDNILWQNRSLWWDSTANGGNGSLRPISDLGAPSPYWDLAVYTTTPNFMDPEYSILTSMDRGDGSSFSATNQAADPALANTYFNNYLVTSQGALLGNTVLTLFTPIGLKGNPHLTSASPARGLGGGVYDAVIPQLQTDFDLAPRPTGTVFDAGAAQFVSAPASDADLSITNAGSPQGVVANVATPITYTVVLTNMGPSVANGVAVTDTLPSGATNVSASSTQGTVTVSTSSIGINIGTMPTGATVTITVQITMTASAAFSSTATATSSLTADPNLANNSAAAVTNVFPPLIAGQAQNLLVTLQQPSPNAGTGAITLNWSPPLDLGASCTSVEYDVLRSTNPAEWVNSAICVASALSITTATDTGNPSPGSVFYYLVRAENPCGSILGTRSDGTPIQGRSCP